MQETKAAIYLSLSAAQKTVARSYHIRTAAFWNVIVDQLGDFAAAYVREAEGPVNDDALQQMMDMLYEILINKNTDLIPGFVIPAKLANELSLARQLPEAILKNRSNDIMQSLKAAKENHQIGRLDFPLPGLKNHRSNHTVRFDRGAFEINGDTITFPGQFKLVIQNTKIGQYDASKVKSVSLSRKKIRQDTRDRLGLKDLGLKDDARVYCLTLLIEP